MFPILIGLGSLDQVILHDLLGQLGPLCLDGSVPVQHEDIFWVLLHDEFEGGLVAVGGGVDLSASTPMFS